MAPPQSEPASRSSTVTRDSSQTDRPQRDSPLGDGDIVGTRPRVKKNTIQNRPSAKMSNSAFRFVVVDHPDQLRDRQEMRENRMHVMHDYLNKERKRPESKDSRISPGATNPSKRKPLHTFSTNRCSSKESSLDVNQRTSRSRSGSSQPSKGDESSDENSESRRSNRLQSSRRQTAVKLTSQRNDNERRLVSGIGGRFEHSAYMRTMPEDIPPGRGSSLEPFGMWPAFESMLDVNALKFSCSQRFGSEKLSRHWIPCLLKARHAFLSTLCISSSHDAVMTRALVPSHVQSQYKSVTRWRVKQEVIAMVASCMSDPEMQAADETILAVLHLLNSDIMGCDDRDMRIHQDGLSKMIEQRGGLQSLGLGGELSAVLTITNYLIATLREMSPHMNYIQFASRADTKIPCDDQTLPENPLYCRPSGYRTINQTLSPGSVTYELLETLHALTTMFYIENDRHSANITKTFRTARTPESSNVTVSMLRDKIFSFKPGYDEEFGDMNERYTYESIRLTGLVYATALTDRIPFSDAAARLSADSERSTPPFRSDRSSSTTHLTSSIPIQLKHALMRTDISFCWDILGGVFFWITLIGGAAANPGPFADEERVGEAEDARKFVAALAVRCCIVLSFEYGRSILETLKRLVMIESVLAEVGSDGGEDNEENSGIDYLQQSRQDRVIGPAERTHVQDFWSA